MSIIAAIYDPAGSLVIGSDTGVTDGTDLQFPGRHKWVQSRNTWIGVTGRASVQDSIRNNAAELLPNDEVRVFPGNLRKLLVEEGYNLTGSRDYPFMSSDLLIANPNGIWMLSGDFALVRAGPYWAEGSGQHIALGAMHALYGEGDAGDEYVLRRSLEAACQFMTTCGGDLWIKKVSWPQPRL